MANLLSAWANEPILLTESLNDPIWAGAGALTIPGGFLWVKNDAHFLYAAIDVVDDTVNDPGTGDYFWFTFDRNRDGNINPNFDVNYGLYPGQPDKMGRQYYLGPGTWTGLLNEASESKCKMAFESSPNSMTAHRIWKMRFLLTDLNVSLMPLLAPSLTKFGLRVHSANPSFTHNTPNAFFTSFAGLHTLYFSRKPVVAPALQGPVMGCVGLIPTTKINSVSGKATTDPGYFLNVENAAFGGLLNLIGNRTTLQNLWAAGARKYRVKHRFSTAGSFTNMRSVWYNYRWNGGDYVLESFGADMNDFYPMHAPATDFSIDDLLIQFDSNNLEKGLHQFQIEFFNTSGGYVASAAQTLTLAIDNNLPVVKINSIKHGMANVDACAIVNLTTDTDGLIFNIDAHDAEGNLLAYSLVASWGSGAAETIVSEAYTLPKGVSWTGVQNLNAPISGVWVPEETCAYAFTVSANARTTNGYSYIGRNTVSKHITLIRPLTSAVPGLRMVMPKGAEL